MNLRLLRGEGQRKNTLIITKILIVTVFLLRDINQKIFPILTVTDMSANQWSQFVKKDSGFAFLAYWNDMLVGLVLHICDGDKVDLRGV